MATMSSSAWKSSLSLAIQRPIKFSTSRLLIQQNSYNFTRRSCGVISCHGGQNFTHSTDERLVNGVNGNFRLNGYSNSAGVDEGLGITRFLRAKCFLITGATGFLAKVLIEKILRSAPDVDRIYVLIKAKDNDTAMERMKHEIINSDLFSSLREIHGSNYETFMLRKLFPVVGDVREANIGIELESALKISETVDIVVNSAANTTFDERYDVALDINTLGPHRVLSFAKGFKNLKLFLHVSTAYVNGTSHDRVMEKPFSIGDTIAKEITTSPYSENLSPVLDINAEINLAFELSKISRDSLGMQKMKNLGLERARMFGWQDAYSFTKAMGEMMISRTQGDTPVVIIRPSIVESTYREPYPGWIEGNRMIDPIILYYGKGLISGFHVDPDSLLDIIPVDMVVNATLAAMAKHGLSKNSGTNIYHVASSFKTPVSNGELCKHLYEHFSNNPIIDRKGRPIIVPEMKYFDNIGEFSSYILSNSIRQSMLESSAAADEKLSMRHKKKCMNIMDHATHLARIYQPYAFNRGRFDNTNCEKLLQEMSEEERWSFGFDVGSIDWKEYICDIHIPGLRKHVMKERSFDTSTQLVAPAYELVHKTH